MKRVVCLIKPVLTVGKSHLEGRRGHVSKDRVIVSKSQDQTLSSKGRGPN